MDQFAHRGTGVPFTLMGIWAHPDDETYLSAVLMRRVVRAGGRVVVITATRGELGSDADEAARGRFALHRERELRAALARIGVRDVTILGHPDGGCADVDEVDATATVAAHIDRVRPDLIVTFGPDGITGHPDHVAVGRWATRASVGTGSGLLYAAMTQSFAAAHAALHAEIGMAMTDELEPAPDHEITFHVRPTATERRAKRQALHAHASQSAPIVERIGPRRFDRWWMDETFRPATARDRIRFSAQRVEVGS